MSVLSQIKRFLKRSLPEGLVLSIKKVRHAKKIGTVTVESEPDFRPIAHLVRAGDTVVDLGANMGFYTKFLSDLVGERGTVHSVEPIPSTFRILEYVVRKLRMRNVKLLNCAVSDANETVTMEIPLFDSGEENIFEAKIVTGAAHAGFEKVRVESKSLDSLFREELSAISFIKCDIEGHELRALQGAVRLLAETRPAWLVEVWGKPDTAGSDAARTFAVFEQAGYAAHWFNGSVMKRFAPGDTSVNYFFLRDSHCQTLRTQRMLADERPAGGRAE